MTIIIHTGGAPGAPASSRTWLPPVIQVSDDPGPGPFADGDRYLVGGAAAGAFAGHDNEVAEYELSTTTWSFYTPSEGDALVVQNIDVVYIVAEDDTAVIYRPGLATAFKWQIFPDQLWTDRAGQFSNQGLIAQDSFVYVESDIDGAGFGGTAYSLQQKRALPDTEPAISSFNLLELGHGGNPVLRFTPDGHPVLLPNPTTGEKVWDDENVPGAIIRPGAVAPTEADYLGVRLLYFAVLDEASFSLQMTHRWDPGTAIRMHMHLGLPSAAGTPANIKFQATYFLSRSGATATGPTVITKEVSVSGLAQFYEVFFAFDDIVMAAYAQESAIVGVKVKRIAASANEYGDDVVLLSADAHFQVEKMGTRQDLPPFTP